MKKRPTVMSGFASSVAASAPEMLGCSVLDGIWCTAALDVSSLPGIAEDVKFRFPAEVS